MKSWKLCNWGHVLGFSATILLSILVAPVSLAASSGGPSIKATVVKVDGKGLAQLRRKSGTTSAVGVGQELEVGDKITTDRDSLIDLLLNDGTLVKIGTNSEYKFLGAQAKTGFLYHAFELVRGSVRALVEKNQDKKNVKFRINTPAGTMGVRGTEILMNHQKEGEKTSLYLLEGVATFGNPNCEKEKVCIEVKAGEWAVISKGQKKPSAVERFKAEDLLGAFSEKQKAGKPEDGKNKDDGSLAKSGTAGSEAESASLLEQQNREALLKLLGVRKAGSAVSEIGEKDLAALLDEASSLMRDAQNKLLNRDDNLRKAMEAAMANGTFDQYMKLANRFDDLRSQVKKNRANEDLSPMVRAKKFQLASAILSTGKVQLVSPQNPGSTSAIKKAYSADGKASIMTSGEIAVSDGKEISALGGDSLSGKLSEAESVAKQLQTVTVTQGTSPTVDKQQVEVKDVEAQLTEELAKELEKEVVISTSQKEYDKSYTYYEKCSFFLIFCDDKYYEGDWYEKQYATSTMTETKTVSKTSGVCYETRKTCGKVMKPCDLSQGKMCTPTFVYECTEDKKVVTCP